MASALVLERPGKWRVLGTTVLLIVVALPAVPLLWTAVLSVANGATVVGATFPVALLNSFLVAVLTSTGGLLVGLPAGVCIGLYRVPGRTFFIASLALPLLVPSFLWAIGWSSLVARLGSGPQAVSGLIGCVIVFLGPAISLTLLVSYAATQALSASQVDCARISGGEKTVVVQACRHAAVPALLAATLAGILTLQDAGPGQIFGLQTAASEILTSFSALFDFALAGRQCALLTLAVLLMAVPLALFAAPKIANQRLARQTGKSRLHDHKGTTAIGVVGFTLISTVSVLLPLLGLVLPVFRHIEFGRASRELARTGGDTLVYAFGAAIVAVILSLALAFFVGRSTRLRIASITAALILFSVPSALTALGLMQISTSAPAWTDPLLRSSATVCGALGFRFFPIVAILAVRAWGSTSASWTAAAAVHGVSLGRYLCKIALPAVLPVIAVAALLVSLLATAETGTVLLLQSPGRSSFPLAIFTIMANAPESLVATLCLLYVAVATVLLLAAWTLMKRRAV
jgi:iron(III) transport system permease protein